MRRKKKVRKWKPEVELWDNALMFDEYFTKREIKRALEDGMECLGNEELAGVKFKNLKIRRIK